ASPAQVEEYWTLLRSIHASPEAQALLAKLPADKRIGFGVSTFAKPEHTAGPFERYTVRRGGVEYLVRRGGGGLVPKGLAMGLGLVAGAAEAGEIWSSAELKAFEKLAEIEMSMIKA